MKKLLFAISLAAIVGAAIGQSIESFSYTKFGFSLPSKDFAGMPDEVMDELVRVGGVLEFGKIFMIDAIPISEQVKLGINVDWVSLASHVFYDSDSNTDDFMIFGYLGSKVGPSLTFSPVDKLAFDVFAKLNPVWVSVAGNTASETVFLGTLGMKYSLGFNFRYSSLILGIEYNPGKLVLKDIDTDVELGNGLNSNSKKTTVDCVNFIIGFNF